MHICTHIHYHKVLDSCIPLIYYEIHLFLSGAEGELIIRGDRAYLEPTGPAVYVEKFSASDEI
jgi:hypothetical protein